MTYILKQRDHQLRHSVKTNIGLVSKYYSIPKTITSIPTCPAKTSTRIPYFCEKNNLGSLFFSLKGEGNACYKYKGEPAPKHTQHAPI